MKSLSKADVEKLADLACAVDELQFRCLMNSTKRQKLRGAVKALHDVAAEVDKQMGFGVYGPEVE